MNDRGLITGWYVDSSGLSHAFLRHPNGTFTSFDAPDADRGHHGVYFQTMRATLRDSTSTLSL